MTVRDLHYFEVLVARVQDQTFMTVEETKISTRPFMFYSDLVDYYGLSSFWSFLPPRHSLLGPRQMSSSMTGLDPRTRSAGYH